MKKSRVQYFVVKSSVNFTEPRLLNSFIKFIELFILVCKKHIENCNLVCKRFTVIYVLILLVYCELASINGGIFKYLYQFYYMKV